jgi:diaminopimelate decarboxylase
MHHFAYRDGVLHAEDVELNLIAEEIGTPFYCYSTATLERHYRVMSDAFKGSEHAICYAMKANSNQAVIKTMGSPKANSAAPWPLAFPDARSSFQALAKLPAKWPLA